MSELFTDSGAVFSDCRRYRYRLWRVWDTSKPPVLFIMLNPSTADEVKNDPTVERCERRVRQMSYAGGLVVCNLFGYRATDPKEMKAQQDPIGPENDATILAAAKVSGKVILAWGSHGKHMGRGQEVVRMLRAHGINNLQFLTLGKDGEPGHPLYVGYHVTEKHYWADGKVDCSSCFHKACCICYSVSLTEKERARFDIDPHDSRYMKRVGAGQCAYFDIDAGVCTRHDDKPEECRNWSCKLDPRWPIALEAYLSGKDRCTFGREESLLRDGHE